MSSFFCHQYYFQYNISTCSKHTFVSHKFVPNTYYNKRSTYILSLQLPKCKINIILLFINK